VSAYVTRQKEQLRAAANAAPEDKVTAGVNLNGLLNQPELESIFSRYDVQWTNIYWEASNGVHGAMAYSVGPQSLSELENDLRQSGEIAANDYVIGSNYFVASGTAKAFAALDSDAKVYLVDVGRLAELGAAVARYGEACVRFALPGPVN